MSSVDTTQITHFFSSFTLAKLPPAIITFIIAYAASRVVLKVADKLFARSRMEKTIEKFLRSALRILMWALIFLIVAGSLGIDVSSMIALLSVASLAVTLAVQGALSNLASGIMLLSTHPFRVGDFVEVGTVSGTVQEIGMTYTQLMTFDRRTIFIPNSTVTSSNIVNYTMDGKRRVEIEVSASYDADIDRVKAALREALDTVGGFYEDPPYFIHVKGYGESAIEYSVRAYCKGDDYWEQYYALLEEIKRTFDKNGIPMTYPHLNVHIQPTK